MVVPLESHIFNPTGTTLGLKLVPFFDKLSQNFGGNQNIFIPPVTVQPTS